jgi:hypothetical protein
MLSETRHQGDVGSNTAGSWPVTDLMQQTAEKVQQPPKQTHDH